MSTRCTICTHPKRKQIEACYIRISERSIAERFKLSNASVFRHKAHIKSILAAIAEKPVITMRMRFDKLVEGALGELEKTKVASEKIGWHGVLARYMDMAVRLGIEEARRRDVNEYKGCSPSINEMWDRLHDGT